MMDIGRPMKIFIVEDDELQSTLLRDRMIRDIPHHVHIFKTGEDCLKHMDKSPDVIIMDYNLNKEVKDAASGIQILEIIKKILLIVLFINLRIRLHWKYVTSVKQMIRLKNMMMFVILIYT